MKSVFVYLPLVMSNILDPTAKFNNKISDSDNDSDLTKCSTCFNKLQASERRLLCGATTTQVDRSQEKLIQALRNILTAIDSNAKRDPKDFYNVNLYIDEDVYNQISGLDDKTEHFPADLIILASDLFQQVPEDRRTFLEKMIDQFGIEKVYAVAFFTMVMSIIGFIKGLGALKIAQLGVAQIFKMVLAIAYIGM